MSIHIIFFELDKKEDKQILSEGKKTRACLVEYLNPE